MAPLALVKAIERSWSDEFGPIRLSNEKPPVHDWFCWRRRMVQP